MRPMLGGCPACGAELIVTEVACDGCGTRVRGRFTTSPFCQLDEEQRTFLLLFLSARGNLSEVEHRLGVSYQTVRGKLDEVLARLNLVGTAPAAPERPAASRRPAGRTAPPADERRAAERRRLLEAVARGEVSPAAARREFHGEEPT